MRTLKAAKVEAKAETGVKGRVAIGRPIAEVHRKGGKIEVEPEVKSQRSMQHVVKMPTKGGRSR